MSKISTEYLDSILEAARIVYTKVMTYHGYPNLTLESRVKEQTKIFDNETQWELDARKLESEIQNIFIYSSESKLQDRFANYLISQLTTVLANTYFEVNSRVESLVDWQQERWRSGKPILTSSEEVMVKDYSFLSLIEIPIKNWIYIIKENLKTFTPELYEKNQDEIETILPIVDEFGDEIIANSPNEADKVQKNLDKTSNISPNNGNFEVINYPKSEEYFNQITNYNFTIQSTLVHWQYFNKDNTNITDRLQAIIQLGDEEFWVNFANKLGVEIRNTFLSIRYSELHFGYANLLFNLVIQILDTRKYIEECSRLVVQNNLPTCDKDPKSLEMSFHIIMISLSCIKENLRIFAPEFYKEYRKLAFPNELKDVVNNETKPIIELLPDEIERVLTIYLLQEHGQFPDYKNTKAGFERFITALTGIKDIKGKKLFNRAESIWKDQRQNLDRQQLPHYRKNLLTVERYFMDLGYTDITSKIKNRLDQLADN